MARAPTPQPLDRRAVVALLRTAVDAAGNPTAWARREGVSHIYAGDVLAGRRSPGPAILGALKLKKEDVYVPEEAAGD